MRSQEWQLEENKKGILLINSNSNKFNKNKIIRINSSKIKFLQEARTIME
jgi:hypothetical protein